MMDGYILLKIAGCYYNTFESICIYIFIYYTVDEVISYILD